MSRIADEHHTAAVPLLHVPNPLDRCTMNLLVTCERCQIGRNWSAEGCKALAQACLPPLQWIVDARLINIPKAVGISRPHRHLSEERALAKQDRQSVGHAR